MVYVFHRPSLISIRFEGSPIISDSIHLEELALRTWETSWLRQLEILDCPPGQK